MLPVKVLKELYFFYKNFEFITVVIKKLTRQITTKPGGRMWYGEDFGANLKRGQMQIFFLTFIFR